MMRSLVAAAVLLLLAGVAGAQSPSATSTRTKTPVLPAIVAVGMTSPSRAPRSPSPCRSIPVRRPPFVRNDIVTETLPPCCSSGCRTASPTAP
jgi:hypothetical protein